MIQESIENYLETILLLQKKQGNVRSVDIATEMGYSKPTISIVLKKLHEEGYVRVDDTGSVLLTEAGREIALHMYDRHLLLTNMLIRLGVDAETARADACKIEHDLSETSIQCIRRHMAEHQDA